MKLIHVHAKDGKDMIIPSCAQCAALYLLRSLLQMALEGFFNFFLCRLQFFDLLLELLLPGPSFSLSCIRPLSEISKQQSTTDIIIMLINDIFGLSKFTMYR